MKNGFSATDFLKRAIEFEEQQTEPESKSPSAQAGAEPPALARKIPTRQEFPTKTDDLKIDRSFYKVPNLVDDVIAPNLSPAEEVVYRRLIRMSWGWGRNYCRAGIKLFQNTSGIKSRTTIKSAIDRLIDRKIIFRCMDEDGRTDRNQNGTVYIIPVPHIPKDGMPNISIPKNNIQIETSDITASKNTVPNSGRLSSSISKTIVPNSNPGSRADAGVPEIMIPNTNTVESRDQQSISENSIPENDSIKYIYKDNLKNTLSTREIVSNFYRGIGQKRVTKAKREKAEECIKELLDEEFSLEDIQFAVQWTLDNSKEDIYDFSIIKHTVGQAIANREKLETEKVRKLKKEKIARQEEEAERRKEEERAELRVHKDELSKGEREGLRKRAMDEIRKMEGIKSQFITDMLIEARENEILKSELKSSE